MGHGIKQGKDIKYGRKDKRAQLITGSYSCHKKNGNERVIV
jgi:hypothetical protein